MRRRVIQVGLVLLASLLADGIGASPGAMSPSGLVLVTDVIDSAGGIVYSDGVLLGFTLGEASVVGFSQNSSHQLWSGLTPAHYVATDVGAPREERIPMVTALRPPAPNPFNPSTVIRYQLASAGPVRLVIYDIRGRQIRELVAGPVPAGSHETRWEGRDGSGESVPSGIYFARLTTSDKELVQRLVLLK